MSLPTAVVEPPPATPVAPPTTPPVTPPAPVVPAAEPSATAAALEAAKAAPSLDAAIEAALKADKTSAPVAPVTPPAAPVTPSAAPSTPAVEPDDAAFEAEVAAEAGQFKDPKQQAGFRKLRYEHRAAQRELKQLEPLKAQAAKVADLEAKLADMAKTPAVATPEFEAVRKERDALKQQFDDAENELAHSRLEGTVAFKERIGKPLAAAENEVTKFIKDFEIPEADLAAALGKAGRERVKALSELVSDVPAFAQNQFFALVESVRTLRDQRASVLENAKQNYDVLRQQETEKSLLAKAEHDKNWNAAVTDRWEADIVKHAPFLAPHQDSPDWNTRLEGAKSFAATVPYESLDVPSRAAVMHRAATFPLLIGAYQSLQKLATAQAQRIAELSVATPKAGGGAAPTTPAADANGIPATASFQQAIEMRLKQAGLS